MGKYKAHSDWFVLLANQVLSCSDNACSQTLKFLADNWARFQRDTSDENITDQQKIESQELVDRMDVDTIDETSSTLSSNIGLQVVFKSVICCLQRDHVSNLDLNLVHEIIPPLLNCNGKNLTHLSDAIALLINKSSEELLKHGGAVSYLVETPSDGEFNLRLLSSVCKALLLRGYKSSVDILDLLISKLKELNSPDAVSGSFLHILSDEGVFNKENHAVIKLLHKQKTIRLLLPRLLALCESDGGRLSIPAICSLIPSVPSQFISADLKQLIPLLLNAISFDDSSIVEGALKTIRVMIESSRDDLVAHLDSLLKKLMMLLKSDTDSIKQSNSVKLRISALTCLRLLANYPAYLINPSKKLVLQVIRASLGDHKRVVRQEAMLCSNTWHLLVTEGT